jgi:hypothetical protein
MVTTQPTEAALSRSGTINGGCRRSANSRSRCRNRLLGFLTPFVRFFVSHIIRFIGQDDFGRCDHDFGTSKAPVPWFQVKLKPATAVQCQAAEAPAR